MSEGLLPEIQVTDSALSAEVVAVWVKQALPPALNQHSCHQGQLANRGLEFKADLRR